MHVYIHNTKTKADAMENILQHLIQFLGLAWARENVNIVENIAFLQGAPFTNMN